MNIQDKKRSEKQGTKNQRNRPFFPAVAIQSKLKVNKPGDRFEQEAEKVSQDMVTLSQNGNPPQIHRKEEVRELERKEESAETPEISTELEGHISKLDGKGRSLNITEKNYFEPKFGRDFSKVRIHENDSSAEKIHAKAYTTKNHIVFNQGEYSGTSSGDKKLMAHELTHVVQQGSKGVVNRSALPSIQRQDEPSTSTESLSQEERNWLYDRLTLRMNIAYTKFVDACNTHQRQIRDLAAQNVDIANLLLDVGLAFATRGLSTLVTSGISRAGRQGVSVAISRIALRALGRVDQIVAAATSIGKDLAKRGFQAVFSRGVEEQFVQDLKQVMSESVDMIHGNLINVSDEELSVLFYNYDPSIATLNYYEQMIAQMISDYRDQIIPIGRRTDERYGINRLRWIEGSGRRALALTGEGRYARAGGGIRFMAWITPYFKNEALRRSLPSRESDFPVIHYGNLENGSAPSNIEFVLNSPYLISNDYVFEAPTGQTPVQPNPCPSCHGESGGNQAPSLLDRPFDFESMLDQPPNNQQQLEDWIRQLNE